ncbi:MAG: response regulator [Bacteroidia bacterium]
MRKVKILIIDDHKMIREGLRVLLEMQQDKYNFVIDEADSGEAGIEKAIRKSYDIIIIDYQLGGINGAEAAQIIMHKKPESKILALSNYSEYMYVDKMINEAKIKGYLLKSIGPEELIKAVETVLANKNYYSNDIALTLLSNENKPLPVISRIKDQVSLHSNITKREMDVLKLIAEELTNKEIANKLAIGKRTVDWHREHLMIKLNVNNTAGLVKAAIELTTQKT